jgi:hypothetical protein
MTAIMTSARYILKIIKRRISVVPDDALSSEWKIIFVTSYNEADVWMDGWREYKQSDAYFKMQMYLNYLKIQKINALYLEVLRKR